jgi:NADPH:quinone reductase-like Zn-dependent oxidoreductase
MRAARAVAGDVPPGQDSDLAGVVVEVGPQVSSVAVGDEVWLTADAPVAASPARSPAGSALS